MKVIIAGSRDGVTFEDVEEAVYQTDWILDEVISGGARGADYEGESFALHHAIPIRQFPADWDTYGKGAGYIRNKQMAEYADALIAVWDGQSRGTKNMIDTMEALGKPVFVWTLKN